MKRNIHLTLLTFIFTMVFGLSFMLQAHADKGMTSDDFIAECAKNIKGISLEEAKKGFDSGKYVFLDCRTEKEYKRGSIPNSILLQRGLLEFRICKKVPDKSSTIVIYCKSGKRSSLSACTLAKMGYAAVYSMSGGWKAWVNAGYPIN